MSDSAWPLWGYDVEMGEPFSGTISRADVVDRIEAHPLGDQVSTQREAFARLATADSSDSDGDVVCPGVGGTIVYFHGGGYSFGSPRTHARIGRGLAERTGLHVVLAEYPLAPEHRWPAQRDVAIATLRSVDGPVVVAGDSAGGHLAIVATLAAARAGRSIAGLLLFSPNTDRSGLSDTRERNDPLDPMVDDAGDRELAQRCFGDLGVGHIEVSPVLDDLSLLPPVHIEVGGDEVLLGDSLVLERGARAAGVTVTLHVDPDGLHMGQLWVPWWPVASESLDRAADFARSAVAAAPRS